MKKLLTLALGLFVTGLTANAQSTAQGVRFGIKGGPSFSNIIKDNGNNSFKTDYLVGFNAGITVDIKLMPKLAFTPELVYATKGYKLENEKLNTKFTQTTHFIDIPILATINVVDGLNLVVGPQVSFLLSTHNKFETGFGKVEEKQVEDDSDRFKKSLLGGVIGARYDINRQIGVFGRYSLDFQKNNENGTTSTPEYKNQGFQAGLGFKF